MPGKVYCSGRAATRRRGEFPADLKFYWLHFEVQNTGQNTSPLAIEQHCSVREPQYIISCSANSERAGKIHRSVALELMLLLILQQVSALLDLKTNADSPARAGVESAANHSYAVSFALSAPRWRRSCTATPIIWGACFAGPFHLT
jgi:hypothetical protein